MSSQVERARRRGCLPIVAGVVVLFVLLLIAGIITAMMKPPIFMPPDRDDVEAEERATSFEKNFSAEFTRVRDNEEPWGVRVRQEDLNAWLWFRLPSWVAHMHGEGALGSDPLMQVQIDETGMRLATDSVVFGLTTEVHDGRAVVVPASGSSIGRLPLPGVWASELAMSSFDLDQLSSVVANGDVSGAGGLMPSAVELPDGRIVEFLEFQPADGEAVLVFRTLRP